MEPLGVSPSCRVTKGLKKKIYFRSWLRYVGCSSEHTGLLAQQHVEKEMATHSSILAWKISRMEEPGGPTSMGSQRV